jgi:hypothetical protein
MKQKVILPSFILDFSFLIFQELFHKCAFAYASLYIYSVLFTHFMPTILLFIFLP